jgi:hypothetical protein
MHDNGLYAPDHAKTSKKVVFLNYLDYFNIRPFLLAFVVDRDFLKKLGARGRLSSYFHESTSPYNSTQKLYRVSHNTYLLLQGST